MIQDVFFPRRRGSYFLFGVRIVGVDIGTNDITATQIRAHGTTRTVEKIITVPLSTDTQIEYQLRAAEALKTIASQLSSYDELVTVIPSSYVIFKRMTVPFSDHEKIARVIPFEVEPLLPFPIAAALIDFIVLTTAPDKKSTEILVVAAQKERVERHVAIFEAAGVRSTTVTVDLLSLYALTQQISTYRRFQGIIALIHIGSNATGIIFMQGGALIMVRTIPKGTFHIAKNISTASSLTPDDALEHLIRFGVEKTDNTRYHEAARTALTSYLQEIFFTFTSSTPENAHIEMTLLLGPDEQIPGLLSYATEILHTPCQPFDITSILDDHVVRLKSGVTLTPNSTLSLSAVLPSETLRYFNLHPMKDQATSISTFIWQLGTLVFLLLFLFGTLGVHLYLQRLALLNEIQSSEKETVTLLKERFPQIEATQLARVIEEAEDEVTKEEATWFAFSSSSRSSMLKILLELKTKIDQESLDFVIEKFTVTEGLLVLKAKVRDHNALKLLEQALRTSPLFKNFEPQANPDFEMKITLASSNKREA